MRNTALALTLIVLVAVGYFAVDFFRFANSGAGSEKDTLVFEVPTGTTMAKVAARLQSESMISDAFKFRVYAKITGQQRHIKKGEYLLNRAMTPQQILDVLGSGKSIQYAITFPEGANIYDMDGILQEKGFFKNHEFLTLVRNPEFVLATLGFASPSLEGYLYPETYALTKFTSVKELVHSMVQNFRDAYKALAPTATVKMSEHDMVTLASVVEKETGAPEERPIIASVFYNRLQKGMPLQSDPTILYGIIDETGKPTNNITRADLTHPNRYNTYTVKRLPFGPICNPGKDAIAAALKPASTNYLYFVSRNNGTHVFTQTYQEHLGAVKTFQLNPAAREGKSWRDLKKRAKAPAQENSGI